MKILSPSIIFLALSAACSGVYVDVDASSDSNCPLDVSTDFTSRGFRIHHSWPKRCPTHYPDADPWPTWYSNYIATVTSLDPGTDDVIATDFYSYINEPMGHHEFRLTQTGNIWSGTGNWSFQSAKVKPSDDNSIIYDLAVNYPSGHEVSSAMVKLTYGITRLMADGPGYAMENEQFQLSVYPVGTPMAEPVTYQWFRNGTPYGDPTTSNYLTASISGSGFTIPFRVDGTDGNGAVWTSMTWVTVPANCPSPPCAAQ